MQQIFIRLSVFHNGQFFEALFERWDQQGYSAAKKLFAVEPSPPQIFQMVLCELPEFNKPVKTSVQPSAIGGNPKRRQREASKEAKRPASSTKAQLALQNARKEEGLAVLRRDRENKKRQNDIRFEQRISKKKQKHKGR